MPKLQSKAQKSKLHNLKNHSEKIIQLSQKSKYPRSYRFEAETINSLKSLVQQINLTSKRKISETQLLQVLIKLGQKTNPHKILQILKKTSY